MKTKEQWHESNDKDIMQNIAKVQLDAWKQGMSNAAHMCKRVRPEIHSDTHTFGEAVKNDILQTAESKLNIDHV